MHAAETSVAPVEEGAADGDVSLELFRQHSLLTMMAARFRELATWLNRTYRANSAEVRRALSVHRRFLIEVHEADEASVAASLAPPTDPAAVSYREDCRRDRAGAARFQQSVQSALRTEGRLGVEAAWAISALLVAEADRIERYHFGDWAAGHGLGELLSVDDEHRLSGALRAWGMQRVGAEIALVAWAAQIHPSSD